VLSSGTRRETTRPAADRHRPCGYERDIGSKLTLLDREIEHGAGAGREEAKKDSEADFVRLDRTLATRRQRRATSRPGKAEIFQAIHPALAPAEIEKRIRVPVKATEKTASATPPDVVPSTVRTQIRTSLAISQET